MYVDDILAFVQLFPDLSGLVARCRRLWGGGLMVLIVSASVSTRSGVTGLMVSSCGTGARTLGRQGA